MLPLSIHARQGAINLNKKLSVENGFALSAGWPADGAFRESKAAPQEWQNLLLSSLLLPHFGQNIDFLLFHHKLRFLADAHKRHMADNPQLYYLIMALHHQQKMFCLGINRPTPVLTTREACFH
jgi:hypothetical protein